MSKIITPENYKGYYFPECTEAILRRINFKKNILISGESGTGKSEFIKKLAEFTNNKVIRINFNVGVTEQHLIGKYVVKNQQTEFVYGLIPTAMQKGWWVLLDEIDFAQPEHLSALQAILEGDSLIVTSNEGEEIKPHKNFRIFATANTKGRGDATSSYSGTNFLNIAFLDRWSIFEFKYNKKAEKETLKKILDKDEILQKQVYQLFALMRKSSDSFEITNAVFSTRRMFEFANSLADGETIYEALQYELFNRFEEQEKEILLNHANDVWEREYYIRNNWKIGDKHLDSYKVEVTSFYLANNVWVLLIADSDIDSTIKKGVEFYANYDSTTNSVKVQKDNYFNSFSFDQIKNSCSLKKISDKDAKLFSSKATQRNLDARFDSLFSAENK